MAFAVARDGCRLWTARAGDGPPLLLVHGGPGWWDMFGGLVALLGDRFTLVRRLAGRDGWLWRVSTGFADPATAFAQAERLTAGGFAVNDEYAAAVAVDDEVDCTRVRAPVTILHGAADLRPPSVTDSLLAALPHAHREVVAGAGHYPWIEQPAAFRALVIAATQRSRRP